MIRLKDRQHFIPNGFVFYLPQLPKWRPPRMVSFDRLCQEVLSVVQANPALAQANNWPTTKAGVEDWVDQYNAMVCARMGWDAWIASDAPVSVPKMSASHQKELLQSLASAAATAKDLVRGAKTLMEWDDSGEPAVTADLSTHRAIVCSACPLNSPEDFTRWFTLPAAELIKRRIQKLQERKLTTPRDELLNLCTACHCPLKLKVHVPIKWIAQGLSDAQKAKLKEGKDCWILAELEREPGACGPACSCHD